MSIQFTSRNFVLGSLLGLGVVLSFLGAPAHATEQAVAKLQWDTFLTPLYYTGSIPYSGLQFIAEPGQGNPFSLTVETASGGPIATPSIMWPAGIRSVMNTFLSGGTIMTTVGGAIISNPSPYFPSYFSVVRTQTSAVQAGTLMKNAGPASAMNYSWPATTTICNNSCLPRFGPAAGTLNGLGVGPLAVNPGTKRFGGTARLLTRDLETLVIKTPLGGFSFGSNMGTPTAMGAGPNQAGNYWNPGIIQYTNLTDVAITKEVVNQNLEGAFTTGTVRAFMPLGSITTDFTKMGSHNLNPTNLTGTITLVKPNLGQDFVRVGGVVTAPGDFNIASIERLTITFLPEPGFLALSAFGVLGLTGAAYARRSEN